MERFGLVGTTNWFPFHFEYMDLLYGLVFQPIDLQWRQLETIEDLFELLFELSFVQWMYSNGIGTSAEQLGFQLFGIPEEFQTSSLQLQYKGRCRDPLIFVPTFLPTSLPVQSYNLEELQLLLKWLEIDDPKACILSFPPQRSNVTELRGYIQHALQLLNRSVPYTTRPGGRARIMNEKEFQEWLKVNSDWVRNHSAAMSLYCRSIRLYVSGSGGFNGNCRGDESTAFINPMANILKAFATAPPLPSDLIVHRVIIGKIPAIMKYKVGDVITEPAVMSTSTISLGAVFEAGGSVKFEFTVKQGHPAIAIFLLFPGQWELIFPPGTRYRITSKQMEGKRILFKADILPFGFES